MGLCGILDGQQPHYGQIGLQIGYRTLEKRPREQFEVWPRFAGHQNEFYMVLFDCV